jgi:hypothetical protein
MSSAWGNSWGSAWGYSWGSQSAIPAGYRTIVGFREWMTANGIASDRKSYALHIYRASLIVDTYRHANPSYLSRFAVCVSGSRTAAYILSLTSRILQSTRTAASAGARSVVSNPGRIASEAPASRSAEAT